VRIERPAYRGIVNETGINFEVETMIMGRKLKEMNGTGWEGFISRRWRSFEVAAVGRCFGSCDERKGNLFWRTGRCRDLI
jgi:hypothetical protein